MWHLPEEGLETFVVRFENKRKTGALKPIDILRQEKGLLETDARTDVREWYELIVYLSYN